MLPIIPLFSPINSKHTSGFSSINLILQSREIETANAKDNSFGLKLAENLTRISIKGLTSST